MKNIFVITYEVGEYSDRDTSVVQAFSLEADAKAFCDEKNVYQNARTAFGNEKFWRERNAEKAFDESPVVAAAKLRMKEWEDYAKTLPEIRRWDFDSYAEYETAYNQAYYKEFNNFFNGEKDYDTLRAEHQDAITAIRAEVFETEIPVAHGYYSYTECFMN